MRQGAFHLTNLSYVQRLFLTDDTPLQTGYKTVFYPIASEAIATKTPESMNMTRHPQNHLIEAEVTEAFEIMSGSLESGIIFICEHASNFIPRDYDNLGLEERDLNRHVAFDIGAEVMTRTLASAFKAPAVLGRFSRLLIDPNRGSDDPTLVMRLSDGALVPGNARVGQDEVQRRIERFHAPLHDAITMVIDQALEAKLVPVIICIHSFTRVMNGSERPWHAGVLWDNDPRLSLDLLKALWSEPDLVVGDNQPYDGALAGDTIDVHATLRGLANTLIEVRNDLIDTEVKAVQWGERMARLLRPLLIVPQLREIQFHGSRATARIRPRT